MTIGDNNPGDIATKSNASGVMQYSYDVFGQLKSVTFPNSAVISYKIDGENKRFARLVNNSIDQFYSYNRNGQLVGTYNPDGSLQARYEYLTQGHSPDYMVLGNITYRLIKDQLGSIRLVMNTQSGAIAQRLDYDEYGVVTADTNPGFQVFGYAGGLYDSDTKPNRILRRPSSNLCIIIPSPEPNQFSIAIVQPTSITKYLKPRICICCNYSVFIVI